MSIAITYSVFFLLVVVLQCLPPSYYWDKNQTGRCSSPDLIVGTSVTYGVVCMATDFTIGTIPIFIVRHLQMNTRTKLAVTGVLAMATVFVLPTCLQLLPTSETNLGLVQAWPPSFDSLIYQNSATQKTFFVSYTCSILSGVSNSNIALRGVIRNLIVVKHRTGNGHCGR